MSFINSGLATASVSASLFVAKKLPALVAGAIAALLSSQASAGFPTWYGKLHVSLNQYDFEKVNFAPVGTGFAATGATTSADELDNWSIESNGSRIGVAGDFGLSYDLKAIYRLEYGTKVDNGSSGGQVFSQRNIWAGIEGDFGRVIVGKNDSPLKTVQTNSLLKTDIDRFNDVPLADIGSYIVGENRPDNVVQYASPVLAGGLELNVALVQAEETGVYESASKPQNDNGVATGFSASVTYGKANWYLGAAYDSNVATSDTLRVLGEIGFGPLKLGAIYQDAERHDAAAGDVLGGYSNFVGATISTKGAPGGLNQLLDWDGSTGTAAAYQEQTAYIVNALWKVGGPWTVKAQYGTSSSTPVAAFADVDLTNIAVGADFKLSDNAKLYSYYASIEAEGDSRISTQSVTDSTFGLGLDIKF